MSAPAQDRPLEVERAAVRASAARDRLLALHEERERLVRQRDDAVCTLSAAGWSYDAIADVAGVSRARVGQIVTARRSGGGQRS